MADKSVEALQRIERWLEEHPDSFVTFSGGKDSTVVLHLLKQVQPNPRIAFFDSGLLFKQTYSFVKLIQKRWNVEVSYITTSPSPLDVFEDSGLWEPGKEKRSVNVRRVLIDNYLDKAREHFDTCYSIYGLHADESEARRFLLNRTKGYVYTHDRKGNRKSGSLAPIWDWTTKDVNSYIVQNKLPLNTAYRKLRELGVPADRRRTGVVLGDGIHLGDWAMNYQVDPSLGNVIESRFPMLQGFR